MNEKPFPEPKPWKKFKKYQTAFRLDSGSYKQMQCKSNIFTSNHLQYNHKRLRGLDFLFRVGHGIAHYTPDQFHF